MKVDGIGVNQPVTRAQSQQKDAGDQFKVLLQKAASSGEDKELKEAAKQFEALFFYRMLSQMRASVPKGGLLEESMGEKIFRGMLDQEISLRAVQNGNLGLADMIYGQLKRK